MRSFASDKHLNFSFKIVCFLTIFVLAFFAVSGGVFTESKFASAGEEIADWLNFAINAASLVANLTGADWLAQIANYVKTLTNLYQTFSNNANTQDQMDKIMREVLRLALNEFHRMLIAFINSKGDPKVIQDFHKEFIKLAEGAAGEFLNQLAGFNLCNKDWSTRITLLLPAAPAPLSSRFKCSLSDIAKQMQATAGVSVSVETVGFDEFARMFEPQNNFLGTFLMASSEQGARVDSAVEVGKLEATVGKGVKPARDNKGNIITPGFLVADLTKEGTTKDYDLWARQLAAVTPFRGKTSALTVVNYILGVANSMAAMAIQNGLVNVKEDDLPSGTKWEPEKYSDIRINNSASNQASEDAGGVDALSQTLKQMKEKMAETKDKLGVIVPIIQQIVDKEKTLPSLLVSKMNESSGAVCGFNSFSNYLTVSKTLISSDTQTPDADTTIITEKYEISVSDAASGEKYVEKAEITKITTQTQTLDEYQQPTTTTTVVYSLNSQSIVAGHQIQLNQYQSSLNNYQTIQDKIDEARNNLAELKTKASNFAAMSCAIQGKSDPKLPDDLPNQDCKNAYNIYAAARNKAVISVQTVYKLMSGKYAYATSGAGVDLDADGNGTIANDEKNLEGKLDNLNSEFTYLYESINEFNSKFTTEQVDAAAGGAPANQLCANSKGFYKTKYCLNDAYSGVSGVSCSQ